MNTYCVITFIYDIIIETISLKYTFMEGEIKFKNRFNKLLRFIYYVHIYVYV